jgi:CheY-like chemotaxis protein
MGLAAVYGTIESHKGAITIESDLGIGTKMQVFLPHFTEDKAPIDSVEMEQKPVQNDKKILLVDDEPIVIDICTIILKSAGYDVVSCQNGQEAIQYYRDHWKNIDLVILDMVMPEMSGTTAYRKMRDINPNVIALLSSGYSINDDAQQILEEGANGFIQKPFRKATLLETVANMLANV